MDTAILVDELNKNAIELVNILNKRNFNFTVAALMKNEDQDDWYLVLGIPGMRLKGSRDFLYSIYDIIEEENLDISLTDIKAMDDQDKIFALLRSQFEPGKIMTPIFFNGNYISGTRIPDSIIYRIN